MSGVSPCFSAQLWTSQWSLPIAQLHHLVFCRRPTVFGTCYGFQRTTRWFGNRPAECSHVQSDCLICLVTATAIYIYIYIYWRLICAGWCPRTVCGCALKPSWWQDTGRVPRVPVGWRPVVLPWPSAQSLEGCWSWGRLCWYGGLVQEGDATWILQGMYQCNVEIMDDYMIIIHSII